MLEQMSRLLKGGAKTNELIARADAARDAKNWEAAAKLYRVVLDEDPSMAHIWVQYGHMLKESGRHKEAEQVYGEALTIKEDADTHLQLGHLHKIMGRRRQAEEDYLRALERQPDLVDARTELGWMGWNSKRLRAFLAKGDESSPQTNDVDFFIAFELSDLIDHLQRARYPTGIQRVQLALGAALAENFGDDRVQFVYYDHLQSEFFELHGRQLLDLAELVNDAKTEHETQKAVIDAYKGGLNKAEPFEFPDGAYLVNVGTSWGFLNYFLSIREIKRRSRVRYVPFVHDCIPIIYPEFCNPNLVCDFINWISHMLGHADFILANSENTKADVAKVATELGIQLPLISTIRLNGEYGNHKHGGEPSKASADLLRAHNLDLEEFVLFVSTIEPRKNHMLALNTWSRMLKARPAGKIPRLVCVGSSGWMNDAFYQRLETDRALQRHVIVLQNVSEQALQLLYQRCLFTVFPSLYEGWGLPISEALAYGKVPLVSNVSSHLEAGGDHAVYFDLKSEAEFQTKLEKLINDPDERRRLEAAVQSSRPLRAWAEIANDILTAVETHCSKHSDSIQKKSDIEVSPAIVCGRYYSMARSLAADLQTMVHSGDIYRAGVNWHGPEPAGCWIRGLSADIAFQIAPEEGNDFVLYVQWFVSANLDNEITFTLPPSSWSRRVPARRDEEHWDAIPFHFSSTSKREVRLRIAADILDDFGKATEGRDTRLSSAGVKGIYVCRAGDSLQKAAIIEAMQFGSMDAIARRQGQDAVL